MSGSQNMSTKEKRSRSALPLVAALLVALALIIFLALFSIGQTMDEQRLGAEAELEESRQHTEELEAQLEEIKNSDPERLLAAMDQLEDEIVPASVVLEETMALLPEDAAITMFDYTYPDKIELEALMTAAPELAAFQFHAEESALIQKAEIDIVQGEAVLEEAADNPLWFDDFLPSYFATIHLVLHPDAIQAYEPGEEEEEVELP
ncbi:hypothetical protein ACFO4L_12655 [Bacillus daqingensis]|uniref:Uncharacterized protein n=2 Tax=Bacillus daqingensis TaxID=872396 RepID=A0ABV9NZG9_9BACI